MNINMDFYPLPLLRSADKWKRIMKMSLCFLIGASIIHLLIASNTTHSTMTSASSQSFYRWGWGGSGGAGWSWPSPLASSAELDQSKTTRQHLNPQEQATSTANDDVDNDASENPKPGSRESNKEDEEESDVPLQHNHDNEREAAKEKQEASGEQEKMRRESQSEMDGSQERKHEAEAETYVKETESQKRQDGNSDHVGEALIDNEQRIFYHHYKPISVFSLELYENDKTFAAVEYIHLNSGSRMIRCTLYDIEKHPHDVARFTKAASLPVVRISFREMRSTIKGCQSLGPVQYFKELQRYSGRPNNTGMSEGTKISHALMGIIPGTKWCGLGDIATEYGEMGEERDVDECCRAHDHCSVRLKSFRAGYGVINLSLYTRSHCDCDIDFYACLKSTRNPVADLVGKGYFNLLKTGCLSEASRMTYPAENCTLISPDPSQPHKYAVHCLTCQSSSDTETKQPQLASEDQLSSTHHKDKRSQFQIASAPLQLAGHGVAMEELKFQGAFLKY